MRQAGRVEPTIYFLDALQIIIRKLEVVRFHVLVKWCHDSSRVIGMLKPKSMTQLVNCYQEQIISCQMRRIKVKIIASDSQGIENGNLVFSIY